MVNVKLHGVFENFVKTDWLLNVKTVGEAFEAIEANSNKMLNRWLTAIKLMIASGVEYDACIIIRPDLYLTYENDKFYAWLNTLEDNCLYTLDNAATINRFVQDFMLVGTQRSIEKLLALPNTYDIPHIHSWLAKNKPISFNTNFSKGLFQNFKFDWVGKRKYFYIFSISVTILGVGSLFTRSLKQSVEFTGGRTYKVEFNKKANIEKIRAELEKTFIENGEVSSVDLKTISNDFNVEITTNYKLSDDKADSLVAQKLLSALKPLEGQMGKAEIKESRTVSNSISSELWSASYISMTFALIAIFLYILFRFGYWQYSVGAIVGLIHDAFFVISVFSLLHGYLPFSLDVNQAFIAAILTVIGYSMNDTVIVFDRIRENLRSAGETDHHYEIINKSLNTTLSRTFNTSMILFMVVLIMFLFGGPSIKGFLFALLVGVIIGTYSSLCVATPILIDFSKRLKA